MSTIANHSLLHFPACQPPLIEPIQDLFREVVFRAFRPSVPSIVIWEGIVLAILDKSVRVTLRLQAQRRESHHNLKVCACWWVLVCGVVAMQKQTASVWPLGPGLLNSTTAWERDARGPDPALYLEVVAHGPPSACHVLL